MGDVLSYLLVAALVAIAAVLFFGVFNMARGGSGSSMRSNKLMRWRVGLQLAALILIVLIFLSGQQWQ